MKRTCLRSHLTSLYYLNWERKTYIEKISWGQAQKTANWSSHFLYFNSSCLANVPYPTFQPISLILDWWSFADIVRDLSRITWLHMYNVNCILETLPSMSEDQDLEVQKLGYFNDAFKKRYLGKYLIFLEFNVLSALSSLKIVQNHHFLEKTTLWVWKVFKMSKVRKTKWVFRNYLEPTRVL